MRATLFQPGKACLEGGGRQRLHVDVHHLGQIGRFRRGEIAGRDRSHDGARRRNGIRHLVERRRSSVTGSCRRGGSSRSMQMRSAAMFPCLARLIAVRAMLSASRSSMSCRAIVALLRDPPAGRPDFRSGPFQTA